MTNQALKLKPNIVVFAVLSDVSPSVSLASSWSVTTRLVYVAINPYYISNTIGSLCACSVKIT